MPASHPPLHQTRFPVLHPLQLRRRHVHSAGCRGPALCLRCGAGPLVVSTAPPTLCHGGAPACAMLPAVSAGQRQLRLLIFCAHLASPRLASCLPPPPPPHTPHPTPHTPPHPPPARYAVFPESPALRRFQTCTPLLIMGSHDWNVPNAHGQVGWGSPLGAACGCRWAPNALLPSRAGTCHSHPAFAGD